MSGDFVFVSDDAPGETVMGFYLFKRREETREPETEEQLARRLGWRERPGFSPSTTRLAARNAVRHSRI